MSLEDSAVRFAAVRKHRASMDAFQATQSREKPRWEPHTPAPTSSLLASVATIASMASWASGIFLILDPPRLIIERHGERWPGGPRLRDLVIDGVSTLPSDPAADHVTLAQRIHEALIKEEARDALDLAGHRLLASLGRRGNAG